MAKLTTSNLMRSLGLLLLGLAALPAALVIGALLGLILLGALVANVLGAGPSSATRSDRRAVRSIPEPPVEPADPNWVKNQASAWLTEHRQQRRDGHVTEQP